MLASLIFETRWLIISSWHGQDFAVDLKWMQTGYKVALLYLVEWRAPLHFRYNWRQHVTLLLVVQGLRRSYLRDVDQARVWFVCERLELIKSELDCRAANRVTYLWEAARHSSVLVANLLFFVATIFFCILFAGGIGQHELLKKEAYLRLHLGLCFNPFCQLSLQSTVGCHGASLFTYLFDGACTFGLSCYWHTYGGNRDLIICVPLARCLRATLACLTDRRL